jgi:predicted chitinase
MVTEKISEMKHADKESDKSRTKQHQRSDYFVFQVMHEKGTAQTMKFNFNYAKICTFFISQNV